MSRVVILDSGPVWNICGPKGRPGTRDAQRWLSGFVRAGVRVILPEIVDYEVRRELIRRRAVERLGLLDVLGVTIEYLPITTDAMPPNCGPSPGRPASRPQVTTPSTPT